MRRETKIGLLAIAAVVIVVLGFNFLKGKELFSSTNTYYVIYENVAGLGVGDGVKINGYRVGQVTSIVLDPDNVRALTVGMRLEEEMPIPKSTGALIKSDGILGGKFISLEFDRACTGADCAIDGDYLVATEEGLLQSLIGDPEQIKEYANIAREAAGPFIDSITNRLDTNGVGRTLRNTEAATANLAALTARIDRLLSRTSSDLEKTTRSVAGVMQNLEQNNSKIANILRNVDSTTSNLAAVDLGTTLREVDKTLTSLQATLANSGGAIDDLNKLTSSLENGEGTLGMLIKEDDMHVTMERTLANLDLLLQDLRLNPKRYVNVSVFGKKDKDYELPEEDPAQPILPKRD